MLRTLGVILMTCMMSANASAQRLVSLNPCFDAWVPQWLPAAWEFVPSTTHGNRLERILAAQPDAVLYGTYTNARLVAALDEATQIVRVDEPNSWSQWQQSLATVGAALQLERELSVWAIAQEQRMSVGKDFQHDVLIIMPNQYSWGGSSFIVDMLRHHGVSVVVADEDVALVQIRLEQLIQMQPERVVLDGFASDYARANDWLWHNALQPWLQQRQVVQIPTELSGCPAQRADDYLNKVTQS
ncbi:hypothetical protein [Pseudidiomarina sp.]|uniref:hypothetical protein n=1 Tax=Pseudidiomarina sp. TaxID=2081707 RepID=UPI003A96C6BA